MTLLRRLNNGIRIVMEEMPTYRSVSIGVWVRVGSMYENTANNGMAHVIEHMLFKGTSRRTAADIANEMTAIGGNMDAFTCKDCTCYYAKTLDIYAEQALDILGDMLCNSLFDEKELKKELGVILEEIDMYEDSPEDLVHEHLQMAVWENHPLGYLISGEKPIVSGFTREKIQEFFNQFYVGENIVISVAGHFNEEKMMDWISHYFDGIPQGQRSDRGIAPVFRPVIWKKEKDIEQNHICLAFDCCTLLSDERYVLTVANNLLGGNMNSRLFMKIRDELGLTYAIYSYGSSYEQAGLFQIYAAMQPSQTEQVMEAVFSEISRAICEGITDRELDIAIQQIQAELILGYESSYNRMSGLGKSLLIRDRAIPLEEDLQRIQQVKGEDIRQFLEKYLQRDRCGIAIVGDTRLY
ncbi:insulinase family protein [Frisingicoccus caecimuris]|uniref:Putative Zn-dependent peptidase n=1 Tax=Frisingicoccus caecimuris TaxID=1796636 RepID=A0A4R2LA75_9FIRM|nr:pitrilysin family protein [Frisingicoccus caecimuris]MCR1919030.1 insulinase family protein [Frisingicoccus caecimuris]TCO84808.1 putative Zn-dependent peptidase [Frisingicoccus caecimuris]HAP21801.1 peptidase M16 [Lachnospiraceae bacterium]